MRTRILFIAVVFILCACQKENDEKSIQETKTSILTEKPWKIVKAESKSKNTDPWFDDSQFWPACVKDDQLLFKTNNSYTHSNGATKCDPMDPDLFDEARWKFLDNESRIDMDGDILNIETLNHQQFIIWASETIGADTYYSRYTLEH